MKKSVILVTLLASSLASAGQIQCVSANPRHQLSVVLADHNNVVEVVNEKIVLHYHLSPESARRNRFSLPVELTSIRGDLDWRMYQAPDDVRGSVKLRVIDERVSVVCRYLAQ